MLNAEGFVAECTGDNMFIVKGGQLFTPPLSAGALYGITRRTVMEIAERVGLQGFRAEPDALRFVQRGRMFSDRHGRGDCAGDED